MRTHVRHDQVVGRKHDGDILGPAQSANQLGMAGKARVGKTRRFFVHGQGDDRGDLARERGTSGRDNILSGRLPGFPVQLSGSNVVQFEHRLVQDVQRTRFLLSRSL